MQPFGHNKYGPKIGGKVLLFLGRGSWVTMQHNVAWVEAYLATKWHLDPTSYLTKTNMGCKLGGAVALCGGDLGPI